MTEIAIELRAGKALDVGHILTSWVRSNAKTAWAKEAGRCYSTEHWRAAKSILERGAVVLVAHLADDPDAIIGWAVFEPGVLHYVYVRAGLRKQGIARRLLSEWGGSIFTHKPTVPLRLPEHWQFNPYLIHRAPE